MTTMTTTMIIDEIAANETLVARFIASVLADRAVEEYPAAIELCVKCLSVVLDGSSSKLWRNKAVREFIIAQGLLEKTASSAVTGEAIVACGEILKRFDDIFV